jgi:hypothetical protein
MKWHGFGHCKAGEPGPGQLALFCPACPQPGINLPDNWVDDPKPLLFTQGLVMDGNFSAEHMKMRRPESDVFLTNGAGYMVKTDEYKAHLSCAKEYKEVRVFRLCTSLC